MAIETDAVTGFSEDDTATRLAELKADPSWQCFQEDHDGPLFVFGQKETGQFQVWGDPSLCEIAMQALNNWFNETSHEPHQGSKEKARRARRAGK